MRHLIATTFALILIVSCTTVRNVNNEPSIRATGIVGKNYRVVAPIGGLDIDDVVVVSRVMRTKTIETSLDDVFVHRPSRDPTTVELTDAFLWNTDGVPAAVDVEWLGPADVEFPRETEVIAFTSLPWNERFALADRIRMNEVGLGWTPAQVAKIVLAEDDADVRWRLLLSIPEGEAASLAPFLVKMFRRDQILHAEERRIHELLISAPKESVPVIVEEFHSLMNGEREIFNRLLHCVWLMGKDGSDAVPAIVETRRRIGGSVPFWPFVARVDPVLAVTLIREQLQADPSWPWDELSALEIDGVDASPALPELREIAQSNHQPWIRKWAASIIRSIENTDDSGD